MRDTFFWMFVISILYWSPSFLDYDYWRSFLPGYIEQQAPPSSKPKPIAEVKPDPLPEPVPWPEEELEPWPEEKPEPPPTPKLEPKPILKLPSKKRGLSLGDSIDGFNGVAVYYNGSTRNVVGRHIAPDGYNLGLKYQCVEFVKRYYYQRFKHKMPNPWGHARDYFYPGIADGGLNADRNLSQYSHPSRVKPQEHDILVFRGRSSGAFGHVAIVIGVSGNRVQIIQQNAGKPGNSRRSYRLYQRDGRWHIGNPRILGWLRKNKLVAAP